MIAPFIFLFIKIFTNFKHKRGRFFLDYNYMNSTVMVKYYFAVLGLTFIKGKKNMKKTLLLAGVACLFGATAANASNYEIKPYVGLDWNYSNLDLAHDASRYVEDDYKSATIVAGARMHKYFGTEAFYQFSMPEKNTSDAGSFHSRFQAYGLDALGYLPLGCDGEVDLIGGIGLGQYEFKIRHDGSSDKEESLGYRLNVGAQYNVTENWAVRGMYRHVYTQKSEIDAIDEFSLGVRYSF